MSALQVVRMSPADVRRARVVLAGLLLRTGQRTSDLVHELREVAGVSRRTAFRVLRQARQEAA